MTWRVAQHYDTAYYSAEVERYLRRTRFVRVRLRNLFELVGDTSGRRILDVGCGMGTVTLEAARRGAHAYGIDPARVALKAARRLALERDAPHARFTVADGAALPFAVASFDGVILADVTEHLDEATLRETLAESARVLRAGGVLALYTPSPSHLFERLKARGWILQQDPSHIGLRTAGELVGHVRAAGLETVRAYYEPSHLPVYGAFERLAGRLPWVGSLFRRRICIRARKATPGT